MKMHAVPIVVLMVTAAIGLFTLWSWPKLSTLGDDDSLFVAGLRSSAYSGYYRGFGLHKGPGVFGRSFYRVTLPRTSPEDGYTNVEFSGRGWNEFRGTYPDGTLAEEGLCWVDLNGQYDEPQADLHNVRNGKYYDPAGALRCEIKDGTGRQTYWTRTGTKVWELDLKRYQRVRDSIWYDNGQLCIEENYLDNQAHGRFVQYHRSGVKKREGEHFRGERVGKWVEYKPDGSLAEVTDYGDAKADVAR